MNDLLGQIVLDVKANLSRDSRGHIVHYCRMADLPPKASFAKQFIQRVARARLGGGLGQEQAAEYLHIKQDLYKHYETRSVMPHHLIPLFCRICNVDIAWLFTEQGKGPAELVPMARVVNRKKKLKK